METKIGFFEEGAGNKSITRLIVFLIVVNAIIFGDVVLLRGLFATPLDLMGAVTAFTTMVGSMATFAASWKLIQKPMEKSANVNTDNVIPNPEGDQKQVLNS